MRVCYFWSGQWPTLSDILEQVLTNIVAQLYSWALSQYVYAEYPQEG